MTIPQVYMRQKKCFNIKFDVEDFFLTINKDLYEVEKRN